MESGSVLGIDVGYSKRRASTGLFMIRWDRSRMDMALLRTRSGGVERRRDIVAIVGGSKLASVAIDGPLTRGLTRIRNYRSAEAILSRGVLQKRGKPGQTSSPVGQALHAHATELAQIVLEATQVEPASHYQAIHAHCVVEAFPTQFLAAIIDEGDLPAARRGASDDYWDVAVTGQARLPQMIRALLPERDIRVSLSSLDNHEDRAAVVCALTALCVAAKSYVAVGDPVDGDIVLPPDEWWGAARDGAARWMQSAIRRNLVLVRSAMRRHLNHEQARIVRYHGEWHLPVAAELGH